MSESLAVSQGRIITEQEALLRKRTGLIGMGLTLLVLMAYAPARTAYGPVSLAFTMGYGVYQTGVRHL